jgi:hypothetical protein
MKIANRLFAGNRAVGGQMANGADAFGQRDGGAIDTQGSRHCLTIQFSRATAELEVFGNLGKSRGNRPTLTLQ